jgi:hypothetical protein
VCHLPIKLGAHLRLHRIRLLVSHGHTLQDADNPSCATTMVGVTADRDKYFLGHGRVRVPHTKLIVPNFSDRSRTSRGEGER